MAQLQEVRKRMREESAHDVSMADARRNEALQQLKEEKAKLKESEEVERTHTHTHTHTHAHHHKHTRARTLT